ncbi:MAG: glycosyltransferase, partial [Chthoniobacterales bacterium]
MTIPRITGVVLVRNEDLTVGRAVRNAAAFCDEWIFCDHGSNDRTTEILRQLAIEVPSGQLHRIAHPRESHELIRGLAGQNRWVFGLDSDEIYDPAGLARLRGRLLSGEFARWWMILGNVLHVTRMNKEDNRVSGHLSPPCRSMTKLYNFAAIDAWDGYCVERLHGGKPVFRSGFDASLRLAIYDTTPWDS